MELQQDVFDGMEDNKLPSMLNVLTILTFIGCAFLLWDIIQLMNIEKDIANTEKAMADAAAKMGDMPAMVKTMMQNAMDLLKARANNKIPLMIFEAVSLVLCLYGAIQMRSRKMQGYFMYVIGELLPIIASAIFMGSIAFSGYAQWIGLFFVALFIILYTTQRKYLINK
jgi:hypothetical protein